MPLRKFEWKRPFFPLTNEQKLIRSNLIQQLKNGYAPKSVLKPPLLSANVKNSQQIRHKGGQPFFIQPNELFRTFPIYIVGRWDHSWLHETLTRVRALYPKANLYHYDDVITKGSLCGPWNTKKDIQNRFACCASSLTPRN